MKTVQTVTLGDVTCDPWPIVVDPECCPGWDQLPEPARARGIRFATEVIWALSGRQFSACTACVRPCATTCLSCGDAAYPPGSYIWRNAPYGGAAGGGCGCGCSMGSCKSACAVRLDPAPVIAVTSVKIDGMVVPSNTYQVIDGNLLVRNPAAGCWPTCNDLSLPDTAPGTWSATYSWGTAASAVALDMAAIMACEVGKLCSGQKCRLSGRITQLSRDGVSITLDPQAFLKAGLTSLPEIDQWLKVVNPHALPQRGEVWSPDVRPPRQVTWPSATC